MQRRLLLVLVSFTLLCSLAAGQLPPMSKLPAAKAADEFIGLPENPTFFSALTVILQGGLEYEDSEDIKGPVAGVEREEIHWPNQNADQNRKTTTLKFDDHGHVLKRIENDSTGTSISTRIFHDGKPQSETLEENGQQKWQQWSYDNHGRLADFRRGGEHHFNFKYDAAGRLLKYESNQSDPPEISYTGNTVTIISFDWDHQKSYEEVKVLDHKKRIVDLKVSGFTEGQPKLWYHLTFRYDEKGRVLEQKTDPYHPDEGNDDSPLPGKLVVRYDDKKHSGEQKFYDSDGKLVFHTRFQFDHDGILTKLQRLDASGKEIPNAEEEVDPHMNEKLSGSVEWEVIFDGHDNWTERQRWFVPADGSRRVLEETIRQKITYR